MLPANFSELRYDKDGRGYVVDNETGVTYYVRDENVRVRVPGRRRAVGSTVRVYTPSRQYALPLERKRNEGVPPPWRDEPSETVRLTGATTNATVVLRKFPPPLENVIPLDSLPGDPRQKIPAPIRARFIPGSEPA